MKVNQIGTFSGALDAGRLALDSGYSLTVSLRSSDTNDSFIADLAVSLAAPQMSSIAVAANAKVQPAAGERIGVGRAAGIAGTSHQSLESNASECRLEKLG